ncbi:unnamed protein product [Ixodes persulcatus]
MEEEVVSLVSSCITKDQMQVAMAKDPTLQLVTKYLEKGWPAKEMLTQELMPFFQLREELSMEESIVFREDKVVVPDSLTSDLVSFAHEAHPGIVKTEHQTSRQVLVAPDGQAGGMCRAKLSRVPISRQVSQADRGSTASSYFPGKALAEAGHGHRVSAEPGHRRS